MGWQERGWLVCASFLGFVASVESIRRGQLFPFGPSARDRLMEAGNDQTHRLQLDNPVLFYDGSFDSIFVSYNLVRYHCRFNTNTWDLLVRVDCPSVLRNCAHPIQTWGRKLYVKRGVSSYTVKQCLEVAKYIWATV